MDTKQRYNRREYNKAGTILILTENIQTPYNQHPPNDA